MVQDITLEECKTLTYRFVQRFEEYTDYDATNPLAEPWSGCELIRLCIVRPANKEPWAYISVTGEVDWHISVLEAEEIVRRSGVVL